MKIVRLLLAILFVIAVVSFGVCHAPKTRQLKQQSALGFNGDGPRCLPPPAICPLNPPQE